MRPDRPTARGTPSFRPSENELHKVSLISSNGIEFFHRLTISNPPKVDGEILLDLDELTSLEELGVKPVHQKKLLREIQKTK